MDRVEKVAVGVMIVGVVVWLAFGSNKQTLAPGPVTTNMQPAETEIGLSPVPLDNISFSRPAGLEFITQADNSVHITYPLGHKGLFGFSGEINQYSDPEHYFLKIGWNEKRDITSIISKQPVFRTTQNNNVYLETAADAGLASYVYVIPLTDKSGASSVVEVGLHIDDQPNGNETPEEQNAKDSEWERLKTDFANIAKSVEVK